MAGGNNYTFLRQLIEKIKHSQDALKPKDESINTVSECVCLSYWSDFPLERVPDRRVSVLLTFKAIISHPEVFLLREGVPISI